MLLSAPDMVVAALAVLVAAAARRLTGFGFALLGAPLLSFVLSPQQLVIVILLLQVALGVPAVIEFRSRIDWSVLGQLALGGVVTAPLGAWLLTRTDPDVVLFVLGLVVIAAAGVLGFAPGVLKFQPSRPANVACGMVAGALSSSVGMPGPPVAIYFLGQSELNAATRRAMLIITFSVLACVSLAVALPKGQVSGDLFWLSALLLAPTLLGGQLGEQLHKRLNVQLGQRIALALVILSGLVCLLRAF
ncbi:sulfite exporter TauE/SafE family protein [Citreicella sp. C3M06]|uniref:sulfite exporter TauE/SafE family protein n=1 Tax=Citreicella sp. C3M06 TaxID=2841564 RepID=UPI001C09CBE9|nr:sulfite exporter TauE/SafE family protein [Citreicella sp. C3M06]MBU2960543.1 sulfite exporter TauE/SafE family protein [Citreicella sp. C3M06]